MSGHRAPAVIRDGRNRTITVPPGRSLGAARTVSEAAEADVRCEGFREA
ncbi:hypothetical protein EKD16_19715 [Streptomonospora litoralis]|uniref:Uncharacterized protein n=1 Tax=Streptomonospora litoralis TaxID=2498135 RepID=A0A4P6Q4S9_9ACTN|nr:hypothetical protein EKD16_19715 [Streptomonospora litoralis]